LSPSKLVDPIPPHLGGQREMDISERCSQALVYRLSALVVKIFPAQRAA
jgi:hypothetical protein